MEHINKIELLGEVQMSKAVNGIQHFLLRTRISTLADSGTEEWETMQVNVTAHLGEGIERVTIGDLAHIVGRLSQAKFASADGTTKTYYTVLADKVSIVKN